MKPISLLQLKSLYTNSLQDEDKNAIVSDWINGMFLFRFWYAFNTIGLLDCVVYSTKVGNEPVPFSTISNTIANDEDTKLTSVLVATNEELNNCVFWVRTLPNVFLTTTGDTANPPLTILVTTEYDWLTDVI